MKRTIVVLLTVLASARCSREEVAAPDPVTADASATGMTVALRGPSTASMVVPPDLEVLDGMAIDAACKGDEGALRALSLPSLDVKAARDEVTSWNIDACDAKARRPTGVVVVVGGFESRYMGKGVHELRLRWRQTPDGLRLESVTPFGW